MHGNVAPSPEPDSLVTIYDLMMFINIYQALTETKNHRPPWTFPSDL